MKKMFQTREVSPLMLRHIFEIVDKNALNALGGDYTAHKKQIITVENLMLRAYLSEPELKPSECRERITPFCDYALDDEYIRTRGSKQKIEKPSMRVKIAAHAYKAAESVYLAMSENDKEAHQSAADMVAEKVGPCSKRAILFALFEFIPQFCDSEAREKLLGLPIVDCDVTLNGILRSILLDIENAGKKTHTEKNSEVDALRRELTIAQDELKTFKRFVEESDASFDSKIQEMLSQEIVAFFAQLNNKKYDYLIDSVYVQNKVFKEYKKANGMPYELEGIGSMMTKFLQFIRDAEIQPATKYPPNSIQKLTREQLLNADFEPHPTRKEPLREGEIVTVRVVSCGWNYRDKAISAPIFYEEDLMGNARPIPSATESPSGEIKKNHRRK
ncbi:MAG: hypothetical protein IJ489_04045 [Clostridia bacterium]|nr:hypothetical protein [Clostridia bacterium]